MVSSSHEAMHRIFRDHPEVIDQTFRILDFKFPEAKAVSEMPTDVTEIRPLERRVDTVMRVETKDGRTFILVFEAQHAVDAKKLSSWPYYIAYLHEQYKLPVLLVVVCQDRATVKWASTPITMQVEEWPSMIVQPYVLGPHNIPVPRGPIDAEGLLLAVLGAITHAHEPGIGGILKLLATALKGTDEDTRQELRTFVQLGIGNAHPAAQIWSDLMIRDIETLRGSLVLRKMIDEYKEQGEAETRAETRVADILLALTERDVHLSDAERERIETCRDLATLNRWFKTALSATSADDLLA